MYFSQLNRLISLPLKLPSELQTDPAGSKWSSYEGNGVAEAFGGVQITNHT
jgi:hypothetical protein